MVKFLREDIFIIFNNDMHLFLYIKYKLQGSFYMSRISVSRFDFGLRPRTFKPGHLNAISL